MIEELMSEIERINRGEQLCIKTAENAVRNLVEINKVKISTLEPNEIKYYIDNIWNSQNDTRLLIHTIKILINGNMRLEKFNTTIKSQFFSHSFVVIQNGEDFYFGDSWELEHYFNFRRTRIFRKNFLSAIFDAIINRDYDTLDYFFNDDNYDNWNSHKDDECFEEYNKKTLFPKNILTDLKYNFSAFTYLI